MEYIFKINNVIYVTVCWQGVLTMKNIKLKILCRLNLNCPRPLPEGMELGIQQASQAGIC